VTGDQKPPTEAAGTRPLTADTTATVVDAFDGAEGVNTLTTFETQLRQALERCGTRSAPSGAFNPGFELPAVDAKLRDLFSVAEVGFTELGTHRGARLVLLDLMRNPGTRTTKTFGSLVMVARAVRYIRETGERVMILTPSSANKATALRDAVLRAYRAGLVTPRELQIVTLVPEVARAKLWSSALTTDAELAARNPMCVQRCAQPADVKITATQAFPEAAAELRSALGVNLWYTLDLANYQGADAARAFAERELLPPRPAVTRAHAHSVSSAFGLLGHHFGTTMLPPAELPAQYFLVQHLATPDMVTSLYGTEVPAYRHDPATGLYQQDADPRFPATTYDPAENLEPTFYTRSPATSAAMNEIIARQGGGGIVVSQRECLERYPRVRTLLASPGVRLPADPSQVREWSLVMALTGVLNAIDRGLLTADEVVVHGSGCYSADDFEPIPEHRLHPVDNASELRKVILAAAAGEAI
jgi:hypothetical protein